MTVEIWKTAAQFTTFPQHGYEGCGSLLSERVVKGISKELGFK